MMYVSCVLSLLTFATMAHADTIALHLMAFDLKTDPALAYSLSNKMSVDRSIFAIAAKNDKECWDSGVSVRDEEKRVSVRSVGNVQFDSPVKLKCPSGVTFNLAPNLVKKDDAMVTDVADKVSKFLDALDLYTRNASVCMPGGIITTSSTSLSDANSDPLFTAIEALGDGQANLFDGGVKKTKDSVAIQGGTLLKTLGVKKISCLKKDGSVPICQVTIPNTQKTECVGAKTAKVDNENTGIKNVTDPGTSAPKQKPASGTKENI